MLGFLQNTLFSLFLELLHVNVSQLKTNLNDVNVLPSVSFSGLGTSDFHLAKSLNVMHAEPICVDNVI